MARKSAFVGFLGYSDVTSRIEWRKRDPETIFHENVKLLGFFMVWNFLPEFFVDCWHFFLNVEEIFRVIDFLVWEMFFDLKNQHWSLLRVFTATFTQNFSSIEDWENEFS